MTDYQIKSVRAIVSGFSTTGREGGGGALDMHIVRLLNDGINSSEVSSRRRREGGNFCIEGGYHAIQGVDTDE